MSALEAGSRIVAAAAAVLRTRSDEAYEELRAALRDGGQAGITGYEARDQSANGPHVRFTGRGPEGEFSLFASVGPHGVTAADVASVIWAQFAVEELFQ